MRRSASLFLKLVITGALTGVILIALYLVDNVISSRQTYRDEAVQSISASYASEQRLLGPVFVQPYRTITPVEVESDKGVKKTELRSEEANTTVFPRQLVIQGEIKPSVRRHGLYRVTVYEFQGTLSGHIDVPTSTLAGSTQYGIPYLAVTIKDPRGIVGTPVLRVNGQAVPVQGAGLTTDEERSPAHADVAWHSNLRALLPASGGKATGFDFTVDLTLAGTSMLELVPLADANTFSLKSSWSEPLFAGRFLPRTREIGPAGFSAQWEVSSLASATQHQMTSGDENVDTVNVTLASTIDPYRLSDRAVKYGILFVLLTFGGFFLFEIIKRMQIHPVQYLLVGFCLAVFFLLLISLSEHISFGLAYFVSAAACIGLLTYYLVFVLKSRTYGLYFGGMLTALYAAIYGLLVSEDNALLLGALLLFGVLAIVMIATRKIDWYQRTTDPNIPPPPLPPQPLYPAGPPPGGYYPGPEPPAPLR